MKDKRKNQGLLSQNVVVKKSKHCTRAHFKNVGLLEIDTQNLQLQLPETIKPLYQEINDHSLHQAQSPDSMK